MTTLNKQEFFETLFENRIKHYLHSQQGKMVDSELVPSYPGIKALVDRFSRKFSDKGEYGDFVAQAAVSAWDAIDRFKPQDSEWGDMTDTDMRRLYSYVLISIEKEMNALIDPDSKTFYKDKKYFQVDLSLTSIEALATEEDSDIFDSIGESMLITSSSAKSYANVFMEWFQANKDSILTAKQLKVYETFKGLQHERQGGYTENDIEEKTGMSRIAIQRYYERIEERVLKAWMKVEKRNFAQNLRDKEIAQLSPVLHLQEQDNLDNMNQLISEWFFDNLDTDTVCNIVSDNLVGAENTTFTNCMNLRHQLPSTILYKLYTLVEDRIIELNKPQPPQTKCTVREGENSFDKGRHKDKQRLYKEFTKVQPCYTNEGILFIPSAKPKKAKKRYTMLPTGLYYAQNEGEIS